MPFFTVYGRLPKKAIVVSSPLSVRAGQVGEINYSGRRAREKWLPERHAGSISVHAGVWLPEEAGYFCVRKMEIQCHFSRFMADCRRKLSWFRRYFQYERGKRVKAMILAAGHGKSGYLKKPVISVGGEMLIERHIRKLAQTGYSEVIINVSYLADVIKQKVGYGERHGIRIIYSDEGNCSLNTGGGVKNALDKLGHSPFLLVSAGVFTDWNFSTINLSQNVSGHLFLVKRVKTIFQLLMAKWSEIRHRDWSAPGLGYSAHKSLQVLENRFSLG